MEKYKTICETYKHKQNVIKFMNNIIKELIDRSYLHDNSKLNEPELSIFTEYTPKLANSTYGSEEYKTFLHEMDIALKHHYSLNSHHPEHFKNSIKDMTLVDLVEMLCDWKSASLRHDDGNIYKSIDINQNRFGYSDELKQIFINTANIFLR